MKNASLTDGPFPIIIAKDRDPPTLAECHQPGMVSYTISVPTGYLETFKNDPTVLGCLHAGYTVIALFEDIDDALTLAAEGNHV